MMRYLPGRFGWMLAGADRPLDGSLG